MVSKVDNVDLNLIMAAIATPMHDDESVNYEGLTSLAENFLSRGVEGIYCGGSTGEGLLLSVEERSKVVRNVVRAVDGEIPVVAHVGALTTGAAIQLAQAAEQDGATALSMIPPIYYNYQPEAIRDFYFDVLDATNLPMFIYNIPQFTGVEFNTHTAKELLEDPRIIGLKQTAHSMYSLERMRAAYPDKIYLNGFDEIFLSSLAAGSTGTIGTTVGPLIELFLDVRSRFNAGDIAGAQRVQSRINDVIEVLVEIDVFPAAKYFTGIDIVETGNCRRPFAKLNQDQKNRLDALYTTAQNYIRLSALGE